MDQRPVPDDVRIAFGAPGVEPIALKSPHVWRYDNVVLKRIAPGGAEEAEWLGDLLDRLVVDVAIPRPILSDRASYVVQDWTAAHFVPLSKQPPSPEVVFEAARRLHRALVGVDCPGFIQNRTTSYAHADRVAWGEEAWEPVESRLGEVIRTLRSWNEPIQSASQVVHGDLAGNVAMSTGGDIVVLDVSPYWRPPQFAEATAAIDLRQWYGASPEVLTDFNVQFLIRGALFRTVVASMLRHIAPAEVTIWERTLEELDRLRP